MRHLTGRRRKFLPSRRLQSRTSSLGRYTCMEFTQVICAALQLLSTACPAGSKEWAAPSWNCRLG
jgi:hypothetical protein